MQHLSVEELARLVEEAPTEEERAHLAACAACRVERESLAAQTAALRGLGGIAPRAAAWPALRARLEAEGLVAGVGRGARWGGRGRAALRAAAALALFLGGALAGSRLGGEGPPAAAASAATVADATARVRAAEAAYLQALARRAELSGEARAADPLSRLAALEGIVLTTRAALEEAPADPLINGYHLMAVGQREALLREIDATSDEEWF